MKKISAFSSIELAICIFLIVGISAALVFIFNPVKRISEKRNETRTEDLTNIVNAITSYAKDNSGAMPQNIPVGDNCKEAQFEICKTGAADCKDKVVLSGLTNAEKYLTDIPVDPKNDSQTGTGYNIVQNESGRITVCAPKSELGVDISLSK